MPQVALHDLIGIIESDLVLTASRLLSPDQTWRAVQLNMMGDDDAADALDAEHDMVARWVPPSDAPSHYKDDNGLFIRFRNSTLGTRISNAVRDGIPESIRGAFLPNDTNLFFGWRDLVQTSTVPKPVFLGRAYVSIGFFCYGFPPNIPEFEKRVFELEEVKAVKSSLESIVGPLQQAMMYSL